MTDKVKPRRAPIRAVFRAPAVAINVLVAMMTVFSAYGGMFDPEVCVVAALVAMTLPLLLMAGALCLLIDIFFWQRLIPVIILGWLVSLPPLLSYSPLNFPRHELTPEEKERSFTLLTYNVLHLWDFRGKVEGLERNATLDYILSTDADILNLQEMDVVIPEDPWKVTPEQMYEIHSRYPYGYLNAGKQLGVLSKYPIEHIKLDITPEMAWRMACFRIDIMGDTVYLFNVHLQSIGLTAEDKEIYMRLYDNPPTHKEFAKEFEEVKTRLIGKLTDAFRERAKQARVLRQCIDSIGGNCIVAGDFNDIQDCYAVRTVMGDDMTDAYAESAFGPTITYHGNRFYFHIDQVLYRGNFHSVDIIRGDCPASDHYPLLTTFVMDTPKPREDATPQNE